MTDKTIPYICSNERKFLELKGDGTESVKITINWSERDSDLNGWYVFLKTNTGENRFIKQSTTHLPLIDRLFCETKYFQFDRNAGLIPNTFNYKYSPVGIEHSEYEELKTKLKIVGAWRPIKLVNHWEFVSL